MWTREPRAIREQRHGGLFRVKAVHRVDLGSTDLLTEHCYLEMSPKVKATSTSKDVVPIGKRDVFKNATTKKSEAEKEKPSTTRALVLRDGKHGARGTGEIMVQSKIGGREKFDLLSGVFSRNASRTWLTLHQRTTQRNP